MKLDSMTAKELRALRDRIDQTIEAKQAEAKVQLRDRMTAMAAEAGLSIADVIGGKPGKAKRAAGKPMKDTKNGIVWSGRGRMPKGFDRARSVPA